MLNFYQHLPYHTNPIAFKLGSLEVRWYALMYLVAFGVVYALLMFRIKKKETKFDVNLILDWLLYSIGGLLVGARLGYVFFYNFAYFWQHPLAIILPFDSGGNYVGIRGMSYYGGVVGIILVSLIFSSKNKINFWQLADFIIPAIPVGYFFGRIGNFLNGELFGRATGKLWGMYFADGILRHPSQLYEAFFEGLVIFVILWSLRNINLPAGQAGTSNVQPGGKLRDIRCPNGSLLLLYLFLYGFFRFWIEFFREPDLQIGLFFGWLTLGQLFSLILVLFSLVIWYYKRYEQAE